MFNAEKRIIASYASVGAVGCHSSAADVESRRNFVVQLAAHPAAPPRSAAPPCSPILRERVRMMLLDREPGAEQWPGSPTRPHNFGYGSRDL